MQVNQQGDPIQEDVVPFSFLTLEERKEAIELLFRHLKIEIVRTNANKYGLVLELRPEP